MPWVLKANEQYDEAKALLAEYVTVSSIEVYKEGAQREIRNLNKLDTISLYVETLIKLLNEINTEKVIAHPHNGDPVISPTANSKPSARYERL